MYKLHARPGGGGFVVEAALGMAGVPFEQIDVPKKGMRPIQNFRPSAR